MGSISQETSRSNIRRLLDEDPLLEPSIRRSRESSDLLDLATAFARRKWFLLKLSVAFGAMGAIAAFFILPKWYKAEVLILPQQQNQSSAAQALLSSVGGGIGPLAALGGLNIKGPNDLYIGMLKSRIIADAMIQRFELQKKYRDRDMTDTRKDLARHSDIVSLKEGLISISIEDKDQKRVASMANGYVEELRNLTKNLASQRRIFYEDQLRHAKDDLASAEIAMKQSQQKSGMIQLDAQAKAIIEVVGSLRARIAAKRVEIQALRSFAAEQNPLIAVAENELAGMQSELSRMEKQSGGAENFDLSLKSVPEAGLEYIRAFREVKYRETLYEILAKQYELARLDEARDAALIQVVSPAIEPDRKSFPPRAVLTLLSAIFGLFVGCLMVIADQWNARLHADPLRAEQIKTLRAAIMSK